MNAIYKGKLYRLGDELQEATLIDDVEACDCGMQEAFEECDCPPKTFKVSFGDPELIVDPTDDEINNLLPDYEESK
jgi:hypothetical protein